VLDADVSACFDCDGISTVTKPLDEQKASELFERLSPGELNKSGPELIDSFQYLRCCQDKFRRPMIECIRSIAPYAP
jgi:hypothetical protein